MKELNLINVLSPISDGNMFAIIFCSILIFFILVAVSLYVFIFIKGRNLDIRIKNELNAENALVIDYANKSVKKINFKKLDNLKAYSYEDFIKRFYKNDSVNFDQWVKGLLSGQIIADSEDTVRLFDYSRCDLKRKDILRFTFKLMLCCTKINKAKKILYFNAHFLYNLPVSSSHEFENVVQDLYSVKDINHLYMQNKFKYGAMYLVKFYKRSNIPSSHNEYEIRYQLLNAIYRRHRNIKGKGQQNYYVFSDNEALELVIISCRNSDIGISNKNISTIGRITNDLKKKLHRIDYLLEVKGLTAYYKYVISAGQINKLDKDFLKSVDILNRLNRLANEGQRKYLVYKDEFGANANIEDSYKTELQKIIRLNLLTVNFLPIYRIANVRVMNPGYIALVEPRLSIFKSIEEVKSAALKYNLTKELYSLIVRDVIPVFNDEKENITTKLAYFISFNELEFMVRSFPHMSGVDNLNLILILNNNDLISIDNDKESDTIKETFMNQISLLKERGYEIYLNVNLGDYILREKTYKIFDGFLINSHLPNNFKIESKSVQDTYALYNKMTKFNQPIISYRAHSWQEIELLVKKGIYTFATSILNEPSSVLIPIKKKVSKKLSNMYKK